MPKKGQNLENEELSESAESEIDEIENRAAMPSDDEDDEIEVENEVVFREHDQKILDAEEEYFMQKQDLDDISGYTIVERAEYDQHPENYPTNTIVRDSRYDFSEEGLDAMEPDAAEEIARGWRGVASWQAGKSSTGEEDLIYNNPTEHKRAGNLKKSVRDQNITPKMLKDFVFSETPEATDVGTVYETFRRARNGYLMAFLGSGVPSAAYTCFMRRDRNNVIKFNNEKSRALINAVPDTMLVSEARKYHYRYKAYPREPHFLRNAAEVLGVGQNAQTVDELKAAAETVVPDKNQKTLLAQTYMDMKSFHDRRPWWFRFAHPIDNFREWNEARQMKNYLKDDLHMTSAMLSPATHDEAIDRLPNDVDFPKVAQPEKYPVDGLENEIDKEKQAESELNINPQPEKELENENILVIGEKQ